MDNLDRELKKTIGFRPVTGLIDPECITDLHRKGEYRLKSEYISRACQFYYDYEHYQKGFFIRLIETHFETIRLILRKIGRARKKEEINKICGGNDGKW